MHEVVGRIDVEQAEQLAARIDRGNPAERADDDKNDTENNGYLFERHFSSSMIAAATWSGARRSGSRRSPKARDTAIRSLRLGGLARRRENRSAGARDSALTRVGRQSVVAHAQDFC